MSDENDKKTVGKVTSISVSIPRRRESPSPSPRLDPRATIERARRRCLKIEKPIPMALAVLASHFGGGLWPGLHIWVSGTGVGKTQLALAQALHGAKEGHPALYIGLELGSFEIQLRLLGLESKA